MCGLIPKVIILEAAVMFGHKPPSWWPLLPSQWGLSSLNGSCTVQSSDRWDFWLVSLRTEAPRWDCKEHYRDCAWRSDKVNFTLICFPIYLHFIRLHDLLNGLADITESHIDSSKLGQRLPGNYTTCTERKTFIQRDILFFLLLAVKNFNVQVDAKFTFIITIWS